MATFEVTYVIKVNRRSITNSINIQAIDETHVREMFKSFQKSVKTGFAKIKSIIKKK